MTYLGIILLTTSIASVFNVNGFSQDTFMSRGPHSDPLTGRGEGALSVATSLATSIETMSYAGVKNLRSSWGSMWHGEGVAIGDDEETVAAKEVAAKRHTNTKGGSGAKKLKDVPAGRKQMYFRPVSVTLQCVMSLTIVSLLVYTFLSISRNSDELSATFTPSAATQTLTIASRVATFAPMMCMLFVACRMYILATTEGLGEPPAWVKKCMWLSVAGMGLQLLVVVMLPFCTKKQAQEEASYDMTEGKVAEMADKKAKHEKAVAEKKAADAAAAAAEKKANDPLGEESDLVLISDTTGEQNDVHPALGNVEMETSSMKVPFWILQTLSMLCLYGGLGGVIYGIATFPAQSTKISAAVLCTVTLSALYFFVCFLLWIGRALPESDFAETLTHAALAMSTVVRKAPMFAVLFLASRMRALQLDPPYGMPPFWMQCCFYGITVGVYFETFLAAFVGATGEMKKAYYGVYLFEAPSKTLQVLQHTCAIVTYCLLFPIVHGVYAMTFADGSEAPLSTTLRCVVIFEAAYFGVMLVQSLVLFAEEVKGSDMPILRDSTVSAGISLGLAPLLCILFVATRMRALQITQQEGDPPGWAQDCMLIATFATCVQALCCLLMPIFVGSACQVDDDGNPDYDLEPMVGAYAVAIVKYVALMALHGGVMMVCWSVYAMTPESAHSGNRFITDRKALFELILTTLLVFCIALLFSSAKVIGMAIKMAIESCDSTLLGVEITIKKVALNLFKGYVNISQLKIHNPEDEMVYKKNDKGKLVGTLTGNKCEWRDDYIAKIHLILLKVNVWRIISTLGKEFELQNLSLTGVHVSIEKPNTDLKEKNSNVEYIMNHLDAMGLIPAEEEATTPKPAAKKPEAKKPEAKKPEEPRKDPEPAPDIPKIILHKIELGDIGGGVTIRGVRGIGSIHFHPSIGKICFDDIQRDIFNGREDLTPGETVACIIKAISKKIFKEVAQELPHQLAVAAKQVAMAAAGGLKSSIVNTVGKIPGVGRVSQGIGNFVRTRLHSGGGNHSDSDKES